MGCVMIHSGLAGKEAKQFSGCFGGIWLSSGHFVLWYQWPHEDTHKMQHRILSYWECDQGQSPLHCELHAKWTEDTELKTRTFMKCLTWSGCACLLVGTLHHCTLQWDGPKLRVHRSDLRYTYVLGKINYMYITVILSIHSLHCVLQPVSLPFSVHHISELGRSRQMNLLWMMRKENDRAQKNLFLWILCHEKW